MWGPPLNGRPFCLWFMVCCLWFFCLYASLPLCLYTLSTRQLVNSSIYFPYLCPEVLYFNTCFQVTSATTGVLKRNRVQITGCRATVCCSEWSQPHMLHNKATVSRHKVWEGYACNTTSQDTCLKTETNAFAVKSSSQEQLNHLTL